MIIDIRWLLLGFPDLSLHFPDLVLWLTSCKPRWDLLCHRPHGADVNSKFLQSKNILRTYQKLNFLHKKYVQESWLFISVPHKIMLSYDFKDWIKPFERKRRNNEKSTVGIKKFQHLLVTFFLLLKKKLIPWNF